MIRNAIERCRKQIEARMNVPWAWASRALLHLLVEEPYEALEAVGAIDSALRAARQRRPRKGPLRRNGFLPPAAPCCGPRALKRIECIREKLPGFDWCQRAVLLGMAAAVKDGQAGEPCEIGVWGQEDAASFSAAKRRRLAGGCTAQMQNAIEFSSPSCSAPARA